MAAVLLKSLFWVDVAEAFDLAMVGKLSDVTGLVHAYNYLCPSPLRRAHGIMEQFSGYGKLSIEEGTDFVSLLRITL